MGDRIKKHHFVPQVLQKQFATEDGRIWYSKRGEDNVFTPPKLRSTRSAFRIREYYTVLKDDERSDIVERDFYGRIDDYLGRILPLIRKSFEQSVIPTFSGNNLDSLRKVVIEMSKRTPDFTKSYDDTTTGREIIEATLAAPSVTRESEEYKRALSDLNSPSRLREIGRDVRVRATIDRSSKIEQSLRDFSVRWVLSETHHSFVLSSAMVYRIGNGGPNGLSNPKMEIWMPIAPKIALVLVRDKKQEIPPVVTGSPSHIREVNEFAVRNSDHLASHSERLIRSITGT